MSTREQMQTAGGGETDPALAEVLGVLRELCAAKGAPILDTQIIASVVGAPLPSVLDRLRELERRELVILLHEGASVYLTTRC